VAKDSTVNTKDTELQVSRYAQSHFCGQ